MKRRLVVVLALLAFAPLAEGTIVGPVPPSWLLFSPVEGRTYLGVLQVGETDGVGCTLTYCPAVPVCTENEVLRVITLTVAVRAGDVVLRADSVNGPVSVLVEGTPPQATLTVLQRSGCPAVWVEAADLAEPAPYLLQVR